MNVADLLERAIQDFSEEIEIENLKDMKVLEIDTDCEDSAGAPYLKVINHNLQDAYAVYLDTIVSHYKDGIIKDLVRALKTGEFIRLNGITRIVGYYSRVQNWNKSKIGELKDRHLGDYSWKDKKEANLVSV